MAVNVEKDGPVSIVTLSRPEVRNAVDRETAAELADAFRAFEADASARVAVFTGDQGSFCAGADLQKIAAGSPSRVEADGDSPMGPADLPKAPGATDILKIRMVKFNQNYGGPSVPLKYPPKTNLVFKSARPSLTRLCHMGWRMD